MFNIHNMFIAILKNTETSGILFVVSLPHRVSVTV